MAGPRQFINDKYTSAYNFSTDAFENGLAAIDDISAFIANLKAINTTVTLPNFCDLAPVTVPYEALESSPLIATSAGTEDVTSYGDLSDIVTPEYGTVSHPLPAVSTISNAVEAVPLRAVTIPNFTAIQADLENMPSNPDAPSIGTLPAVPTFDDVTLPDPPTIDTDSVSFDGVRPSDLPSITGLVHPFSYSEDAYSFQYKTILDSVIDEWLGTPESWFTIPQTYERAIFERDASRVETERLKSIENLMTDYSQRGFSIPDGQLMYAVANLERESFNTLSERSREIAFEQVKLALDNAKMALSSAIQYEQLLVQEDNQTKNRAFEVSKFQSEFSMIVARMYVDYYNAQVSLYRADAEIYKTLLEGERLKLDVYKTELEAAALEVSINQQYLNIYIVQLDAYIKQVDLYKAQIEANNLILEQNKIKIEEFIAQVQAYNDRIAAAGSTLDVNTKEINQRVQKSLAISSLAEDTVKRVTAYKENESYVQDQIKTQTDYMNGTFEQYKAANINILGAIESDQKEIARQASAIQSQVQRNEYLLKTTDLNYKYQLGFSELQSQNTIEKSKIDLQSAKYNLDHALAQYELALKALTSAGDLSTGLANASLSAVTAQASMSSFDNFSAQSSQSWSLLESEGPIFPVIQPS